jgi:putative glycosyltransferase
MIINWVFLAEPPSGWTSVIVSIWLLGGLTISFIGIIGIYLSKIFLETKQRPFTIIKQTYGRVKHDQ